MGRYRNRRTGGVLDAADDKALDPCEWEELKAESAKAPKKRRTPEKRTAGNAAKEG